MLLAINCNNTNIKFGVVDGDRIVGEWRQHTSAMRTADEHAVWLYELMRMEGIDPKSVTDAIIGSVVPQANFNLRRLCTRYLNCEPLFIGEPNVVHGIKIKGVGAGADRICNTVGASLMFPRTPVVVVDFGTRHQLRRRRRGGQLLRRRHRARPQPQHRGPGRRRGAAAAHRRREAREGDRHDDGRLHAYRRVLGLCRPDRGHRHAHQGRVRQAHEGGLDRRPRPGVRRLYLGDRPGRAPTSPRAA